MRRTVKAWGLVAPNGVIEERTYGSRWAARYVLQWNAANYEGYVVRPCTITYDAATPPPRKSARARAGGKRRRFK